MAKKTMKFDVVREIALTLPGVVEGTIHGAPSLKVRGKLLACPAIHRSAEPDTLAVRIAFDQRARLIATEPRIFYVTDHYQNHATVLVRLARMNRNSLQDLLSMAWRFVNTSGRRSPERKPKRKP